MVLANKKQQTTNEGFKKFAEKTHEILQKNKIFLSNVALQLDEENKNSFRISYVTRPQLGSVKIELDEEQKQITFNFYLPRKRNDNDFFILSTDKVFAILKEAKKTIAKEYNFVVNFNSANQKDELSIGEQYGLYERVTEMFTTTHYIMRHNGVRTYKKR